MLSFGRFTVKSVHTKLVQSNQCKLNVMGMVLNNIDQIYKHEYRSYNSMQYMSNKGGGYSNTHMQAQKSF